MNNATTAQPLRAISLRTPIVITLGRLAAVMAVPILVMWAALEWHADQPHASSISRPEFERAIGNVRGDVQRVQDRLNAVHDLLLQRLAGGANDPPDATATAENLRAGTAAAGPVRQ